MSKLSKIKDQPQTLFQPDLPEIFKEIYYYLYSNSNMSRAERLGAEMIRILFCKIYDEIKNKGSAQFSIFQNEEKSKTAHRIKLIFDKAKKDYPDVFSKDEQILLDDQSIQYVVARLQPYLLTKSKRDVISESFQAFWGAGLRGEKGQFFTPRNIVKMCVDILRPKESDNVIDPACGSGGFLVEVINHSKKNAAVHNVFGIDKEPDLAKICKAYMAIIGNGHKNIYCADSLNSDGWKPNVKSAITDGRFDFVLTNPPFGSKIFIEDMSILKNYELGHEWRVDVNKKWSKTNKVIEQVPQVLFIERCMKLLKPGGKMAIVLPDGVFGNPSDRYVWSYILKKSKVLGIISLSQEAFLPSTHTKTSVLFLKKFTGSDKQERDYKIFMAIAERVGHDKNGKILFKIDDIGNYLHDKNGERLIDDELGKISDNFNAFQKGKLEKEGRLGFVINLSQIEDSIFIPGFYDPETNDTLNKYRKSGDYALTSVGDLIKEGLISIKRGNEVGSKFYGKGSIPFVRTSDIVNWEIKVDPIKSVPEDVYTKYNKLQDIKERDILMVADGTFLIGRTALVTALDNKIIIQSHIKRFRCLKPEVLHPYLLFYLLNTEIVQRQIREKTFVQATISTLGNRIYDIQLAIPKNKLKVEELIKKVSRIIDLKSEAKKKMEELGKLM